MIMKTPMKLNKEALKVVRSCCAVIAMDSVYCGNEIGFTEGEVMAIDTARNQFLDHILSMYPQAAR